MLIILISIILGIISGLYFKNKAHFCIVIILLILINISFFKAQLFYNHLSNKEIYSQFNILYKEKESNYSTCYVAEDILCDLGKIKLYLNGNSNLEYGDLVTIQGDFKLPNSKRNDGGFDYRLYLKSKGISGFVYAEEYKKDEGNLTLIDHINRLIFKVRSKCIYVLDNTYVKDVSDFLKGLLIADVSDLSKEIKEEFQDANLSHILAISGLHVSYVVMLIDSFFKRLRIGRIKKYLLTIIFLILFLMITNYPISCLRAVIMQVLFLLSFIFKRKNNFLNNLIISFLIILLLNPYNIYNSGMWLSYGGTIGIVFFNSIIENKICRIIKIKRNIVSNYLLKTICTSLAVQIVIFPIMWFCYGSVSITFLVSNLVISGIIGIVIMLGFLSIFEAIIMRFIISFLGLELNIAIIGFINNLLVKCVLFLVKICSRMPLEKIYLSKPGWYILAIYYLLLVLLMLKNKAKCMYSKFMIMAILKYLCIKMSKRIFIIFIIASLIITQANLKLDSKLELYMLDVGQGDSTILITPRNKVIVVDTGEGGNKANYDNGKNTLIPFLLAHKKHSIDYLIISHVDLDHIGGAYYLLEHMKINNIIMGIQTVETSNFSKMVELANKKDVKILYLKKGDNYRLDDKTLINVLWPDLDNIVYDNAINNMSLVFKLNCNNKSILFTGDIEEEGEQAILSSYGMDNGKRMIDNVLKSDIIKVPHHGSKTSSTIDFIQYVNPKIAIIGVGQDNKFGHPNEGVIKRYNKLGTKIYRTDEIGEISFVY